MLKPFVIESPKFLDFVGKINGMNLWGISIFPCIVVRNKANRVLINHEAIHFWQTLETGVIGFYLMYLYFYLKNLIILRNHFEAYYAIPFEKEARAYERDLNYLGVRKFYNWKNFLK